MKSRYAVVHYAEVGLKGRNRSFFERTLIRNITNRLEPLGDVRVERMSGRLLVRMKEPLEEAAWEERLRTIFGIAYFAPVIPASKDFETIKDIVLRNLPSEPVSSFRVKASRADKRFPLTSLEIERELGEAIHAHTGWPVELKNPAFIIYVEIAYTTALIYFTRKSGPGGLPVGVSGKVGLLLSGGIDSPVAGWFALKRGCRVIPIHFHSEPFGDWMASQEKASDIVRTLNAWGMERYLYVVPIGKLQQEITLSAPVRYRVILYRRLMVRIAERLIREEGGSALITGDSLGQVASQTLEGITAINDAATMPILRPLIGMDKLEITEVAKTIGTYEISIRPGEDCCQFLMPSRVATRPRVEDIRKAEEGLDIEQMVKQGLANARRLNL